MKKKNISFLSLSAATTLTCLSFSNAQAALTLHEDQHTRFTTDGYINAFYVHSDVDRPGDQFDRRQSRVKMGFLPNYLGFNMERDTGELTLGARASFWVTINDSEVNGTGTAIDVRQFYGTVSGSFGQVLIGKDFGLFARSNILRDELLAGYGQASDTLGLTDGTGVSFGNIGTGYPYAFPTAQITWRSPDLSGFNIALGILDPYDTNEVGGTGKAYQETPRFESEISYQAELGDASVHAWVNGAYQSSKNTDASVDTVNTRGVGYGVQLKFEALSLTASGFDASGMHPLFSNNLGEAALQETDSDGYLLQAAYQFGKARLALSHGRSRDDADLVLGSGERVRYETNAVMLGYAVNDYLNLVANATRFELDQATAGNIEKTDTLAIGATLSW